MCIRVYKVSAIRNSKSADFEGKIAKNEKMGLFGVLVCLFSLNHTWRYKIRTIRICHIVTLRSYVECYSKFVKIRPKK